MDPMRATLVRPSIIELLKNMDPLDALALENWDQPELRGGNDDMASKLAKFLRRDRVEVYYSLEHLFALGALNVAPDKLLTPALTAKAQLLLRAISDEPK